MNHLEEDSFQFWQQRIENIRQEYSEVLRQHRQEIERLQTRCNDLNINSMMQRAATSYDVKQFCAANAVNGQISVAQLSEFLHQYTDGMVQHERPRKTRRESMIGPREQDVNTMGPPRPVPRSIQQLMNIGRKRLREQSIENDSPTRETPEKRFALCD